MTNRTPLEIEIQPLDKTVDRQSFDCGVSALNDYFQKYALQNHTKNISKTFVATTLDRQKAVAGYYTVSMAEIARVKMPETGFKHLPKYPVPVMRIGRLAVDVRFRKKGIGERILLDVLHRAYFLAGEVGLYAVVVDAKNSEAVSFYHKYGFMPLAAQPRTLFLPVQTLQQLF